MKIKEVTRYLESLAPLSSQESYDNSGLIVGNAEADLTHALISLDCTEEIVQEAIDKGCNLIISHHPILFGKLNRLTGKNYVEKTVLKAIKNDVALYAIHTNLDNYRFGVNHKIAKIIGIDSPSVLAPAKQQLLKLTVFVPTDKIEQVREALFQAGAGTIGNYNECSFSLPGTGTFKGNDNSNPAYGEKNKRANEKEERLEVIVTRHLAHSAVKEMLAAHPYEEVAYDLIPLENLHPYEGAGMIGDLPDSITEIEFLSLLKAQFKTGVIRHTKLLNKPIKRVAWCGGAGSFLLSEAKKKSADIFITGDFKYHEFFDAEDQLIIADIGHFESEPFTIDLIAELIRKKFPTFAPYLTEKITNPVNYF